MSHKRHFVLSILLAFFALQSFAAHHTREEGHYQFNLFTGVTDLDIRTSNFNLTGSEELKLVNNDVIDWDAWTLQVGFGYVYPLDLSINDDKTYFDLRWLTTVIPQVNFYVVDQASVDGPVYRFTDPAKNEATYDMDLSSNRLMFDTVLTLAEIRRFNVYVLAGLGMAWTDVSLALKPDADADLVPLNFGSTSSTGFAYQFGTGVSFMVDQGIDLSLQYLYTRIDDVSVKGSDDDFSISNSDLDVALQSIMFGITLEI